LVFWPLPLLHGRKPYILTALSLFIPLQFPQALAVSPQTSPYIVGYRVALLLTRCISGIALGFANLNFKNTLLDLFGASLQSSHPHEEAVDIYDVRRHGGGMGLWLGIWAWSYIGSIGFGFLVGGVIINSRNPAWGFYVVVIIAVIVLFLNILAPEVRRSPHRRSLAEVRTGQTISRRIARGEVTMHLKSTGPLWWWEEVFSGLQLTCNMLMQPGFLVMCLYWAWLYGNVAMISVVSASMPYIANTDFLQLHAANLSKSYGFRSPYVGLSVAAIALGALLAVPFQKAGLFSRARKEGPRTNSMTFEKRITWTSHMLRRLIFMITLPLADLGFTLTSSGPTMPHYIPTLFAALVGFVTNLAIAECDGLVMETWDTSDLQPGMTGKRPKTGVSSELSPEILKQRTNFSCFPRVSAGLAAVQFFGCLFAAASTQWGGVVERRVGAKTASGLVTGILFLLTVLLTLVCFRWKVVQIVPTGSFVDRTNRELGGFTPVIIGKPSGTTRRLSILELGAWTRWTEIRNKNKLVLAQKGNPGRGRFDGRFAQLSGSPHGSNR
jgi:hypothetical protein